MQRKILMVSEIKKLCDALRISPSKERGQNFLINISPIFKMVHAAGISPGDFVLEVGPGLGILTSALLEAGAKVFAVEIEKKFVEYLKKEFAPFIGNSDGALKIIEGDVLKLNEKDFENFFGKNYAQRNYFVIANLPYQISGLAIPFFLQRTNPPKKMALMLQKEVAKKLTAGARGSKAGARGQKSSLLEISTQFFCDPKIIAKVPAGNFWPRPLVDSAIVLFDNIKERPAAEAARFFKIVKAGFVHPRKKMASAFKGEMREKAENFLESIGKSRASRPEDLTEPEWEELSKVL